MSLRVTRFGLGPWEIDLAVGTAVRADAVVSLTPMECAMLARLRDAEGEPVARDLLLQEVWGYAPRVRSRTVDTTLQRLRVKLEPEAEQPALLLTVRGVGIALGAVRPARDGISPSRLVRREQAEPLVGREGAVEDVCARLEASGWLVLVGPPGVGKSALARSVVSRLDDGSRAVLVVDVDGLVGLAEVERALHRLVDGGRGDEPANALLSRLERPVLVLDGADALAAPTLAAIAAWPAAVLLTSRRELGGEAWRLAPLERAGSDALADQLAARRGSRLSTADRDALWAQTAGLPQALVLAVPVVEVVGADLAAVDWLDLDPAGDGSLREALERALASLSARAQDLLCALSAFEDGFDVEAVRALRATALPELLELHGRGLVEGRGSMRILRPLRAVLAPRGDDRARVESWLAALGGRDLLPLSRARLQRDDLVRAAREGADVRGLAWTLRGAGREVGFGADVVDALSVACRRVPGDAWVTACLATATYFRDGAVPAEPAGAAGLWVRALTARGAERAAVVVEAPPVVRAAEVPAAWKAEMLADIHARDPDAERGGRAITALREEYRDLPLFRDRVSGLLALLALGVGEVGRARGLLADRASGEGPWWPTVEGIVASAAGDLALADASFGRAEERFAELGDLRGLGSARTLRALVRWAGGEAHAPEPGPLPPGLDSIRRFLLDPLRASLETLQDPDARRIVAAWRAGAVLPTDIRGWPMRMLAMALEIRTVSRG